MKPHIAPIQQWDWLRCIVTSAFIACAVIMLTACSTGPITLSVYSDDTPQLPEVKPAWDKLAVEVASLEGPRPSSISVAADGRTFFAFPWADDQPEYGVVEVSSGGEIRPYPSVLWNKWNGEIGATALRSFVCVQSVYADRQGSLWVLDSGNPRNRRGVIGGAAKLVQIDLKTNTVIDAIYFDARKFLDSNSYLTALCVDATEQVAYLLDAANGEIFVVAFKPGVMHRVCMQGAAEQAGNALDDLAPVAMFNDLAERTTYATGLQASRSTPAGLALSSDGAWLYYHTTGQGLFRVPTDKLRDRSLADDEVCAAAEPLEHPCQQITGVDIDAEGLLYIVAAGEDTIYTRTADGKVERVLADPRLDQAEALAIGPDGEVYFSALRRDALVVLPDAEPMYRGVVMKFSPEKIKLAKQLRANADELHAEAARYTSLAEQAEQSVMAAEIDAVLESEAIEADRAAAEELRARSQAARQAAAIAEQLAIAAEFAEVPEQAPPTEALVDVPTLTE